MLKNILFTALFVFCFLNYIEAQNLPVEFNSNMLAQSQGLSENLLLFVPDTSVQILFNPSRAAKVSKNFIFVNYMKSYNNPVSFLGESIPTSGSSGLQSSLISYSGPSISTAWLFNSGETKWLLQFYNTVNRYKDNDFSSYEYDYAQLVPQKNFWKTYSYLSSGSITALKLSRIVKGNNNSFSFGLIGIVFPEERNQEYASAGDQYTPQNQNGSNESNTNSKAAAQGISNNNKYMVGLEYTLTADEWDLIARLSIQRNTLNSSVVLDSKLFQSTQYSYGANISNRYGHAESSAETNPMIFGLSGYFQHKSKLITEDDHYFFSTNFSYSPGKVYYKQSSSRITLSQNYNSTSASIDSSFNSLLYDETSNNLFADVSAGYIIKHTLIDINIITGLISQINYYKYLDFSYFYKSIRDFGYTTDLSNYNPSVSTINKHKLWRASIQLPIYLDFKPVDWFSLYGGINYSYSYDHDNLNTSFTQQESYSSSSSPEGTIIYNSSNNSTQSTFTSNSSIFAGMELIHSSGLHFQFAFGGNLYSYSNWNISIGYVY